jgi:exosortase
MATSGSAWLLQFAGQSASAQGTTLLVGDEILEIERACSGLRMFFGTIAMSVAFYWLSDSPRTIRGTIVLLAAPVAVLTNILRIVGTAWLLRSTDETVVRSIVHDATGLAMVAVAFGFFWALSRTMLLAGRLIGDDRMGREMR